MLGNHRKENFDRKYRRVTRTITKKKKEQFHWIKKMQEIAFLDMSEALTKNNF
jgi:hypothetical protein